MRIFAIADLHLPGGQEKPMHVFGAHWERHFEKISRDWCDRVTGEDIVLLPGDLSWAMRLEDALEDIRAVAALPGRKVILRGNHDYWWNSISALRHQLPEGMFAVQNDAVCLDGVVICGTRGWTPVTENSSKEDLKIYDREVLRMKLSLDSAARLKGERLIVMMHYPPMNEKFEDSPFTSLVEPFAPCDLVYGHLHGSSFREAFNGMRGGVRYTCVACDGLRFRLADLTAGPGEEQE